ncbi:MAG: LysR substrate-binding domain-containing protein [Bacillota bacterium]
METFLLIAQLKNFTRAAAQLNMSQPAVSFQIKSLEEDLKVTLFERNDKRVVLTEAGRLLYPVAMQMVRQYNKVKAGIDDLREIKAGHLILGANPVAGDWLLPLVIGGFREQYPAVTVSLQIAGSSQVAQWLKEREVDMGILGFAVKAEGVECQPWVRDQMVVISPPWHPLRGKDVPLHDLTSESIIVRESGSGNRKVLEQQFSNFNIYLDQFPNVFELGSDQAVINAVRMGLGIGVVSRWAAGEMLEKGALGEVPVTGINLIYDLYLAWNRPDNESIASRTFRSFITSETITSRFKSGMSFSGRKINSCS